MGFFQQFAVVFVDHWYVMVPIAACSAVGLAISVERYFTLKSAQSISKDELLKHLQAHLVQGQVQQAIAMVAQTKSPLARIVQSGLTSVASGGGPDEVQTAMDSVALREVPKLSRWIDALSGLANIAVLLGLVGTVSGMIGAFGAVANLPPAEKAKVLASSISEALNATGFGILVSVILYAAWTFLTAWSQRVIDDIHEASVTSLNFVLLHKDKIFHRKRAS